MLAIDRLRNERKYIQFAVSTALAGVVLLTAMGANASECIDSDGDGWGWDGSQSCRMSNNAAANVAMGRCGKLSGNWRSNPKQFSPKRCKHFQRMCRF